MRKIKADIPLVTVLPVVEALERAGFGCLTVHHAASSHSLANPGASGDSPEVDGRYASFITIEVLCRDEDVVEAVVIIVTRSCIRRAVNGDIFVSSVDRNQQGRFETHSTNSLNFTNQSTEKEQAV